MGGFWSEVEEKEKGDGRVSRNRKDFIYTHNPIIVSSNYCEANRIYVTPSNELSVNLKNYGLLPDLVISNIAHFLPVRNLVDYFLACKLFYHCSNTNHFWRKSFHFSFGDIHGGKSENKADIPNNWKKQFYFRYRQYKEDFYRDRYPMLKLRDCRRIIKSVFLGQVGVGKSSFVERLVNDRFRTCYITTIGVDYYRIGFIDEFTTGRTYRLQLWDTYGNIYTKSFVRGADIVFLCFSIDNRESFDGENGVKAHLEKLKENNYLNDPELRNDELPVVILLGLKCDLEERREVRVEKAMEFVTRNRNFVHGYIENSSKTGKHKMVTLGIALDLALKRIKYQGRLEV